jgi:hypothetical protein
VSAADADLILHNGNSWLKFGTFKLTLDGGMTIGTAFQRFPYGPFGKQLYGKTDPDDRGQLFIDPAKLLAVMRTARNRGWQLTTHDQGGGAVDNFLDTLEQLDDFILWVTIGIIVGGRTGYVLFYNPVFFMQHPAEIFELWKGGMSFHGGFLGVILAMLWFARSA